MWMSAGRFTADARSPEMAVSGGVTAEQCSPAFMVGGRVETGVAREQGAWVYIYRQGSLVVK